MFNAFLTSGRPTQSCIKQRVPLFKLNNYEWMLLKTFNKPFIGCLHDPANIQLTSSISTCILNTFAGSLLDVCWIV